MVDNNIRQKRTILGATQQQVAEHLPPWFSAIVLSYIETGRALPTKEGLEALCQHFGCKPEDLYDPNDLRLLPDDNDESAEDAGFCTDVRSKKGRQHDNMVEFRVWLRPGEKDRLEQAIKALGYRTYAEWFREAYRSVIAREMRLQIPIRTGGRQKDKTAFA